MPDDPRLDVRIAHTRAAKQDGYGVRIAVFVEEQLISLAEEFDEHDEGEAVHYVGYEDGAPVAAARLVPAGERAKFGRIAVLERARGRGHGDALLRRLVADARADGYREAVLDSQHDKVRFYERFGFRAHGGEFDDGVGHHAPAHDAAARRRLTARETDPAARGFIPRTGSRGGPKSFPMFAFFERLIEPFPAEEPTRPPEGLAAFCWHYSKGIWPFLLLMAVLGALVAIGEVALFGFLGSIVDWLGEADRETFLRDEAGTLWTMGLITLVGVPLATLLWSLVFHQTIIGNYPMRIRWQAHRYMLGQSMDFYGDEFAGRVATKVMQAALGVRETVLKLLDVAVYVAVYFIGALVLVAAFDLVLMLPFLVWVVAMAWRCGTSCRAWPRCRNGRPTRARLMTGRVVDSYTNIATVKLFAHGGRELDYARESMDAFLETVHPQMRLSTGMQTTLGLLNHLLLFSVAAIALWQWLGGASTVAAVAVAAAVATRLSGMSHWIMWEMASLFENVGMAMDSMQMLARDRSVTDAQGAKPLAVREGRIAFEDVTFAYDRGGEPVVGHFSLAIAPGEKIGLIGRSGAGKTTLTAILLRLYDVTGGRVLIDGQDIARVTQDSLRSAIAVVSQDTSLLHRSVRENIAYGRPDASEAEIVAATRKANAWDFVADLEDAEGRRGLDAHVGERGVKLSGGQRQRIAIARVFLKDAPILVLDEATSALDSEVEAVIQEQLFNLMRGKTVIAIAHRLSTISGMDRLVVLDRGRIIEEGPHGELVAAGGLYASLWARQSGGFLDYESAAEAAE